MRRDNMQDMSNIQNKNKNALVIYIYISDSFIIEEEEEGEGEKENSEEECSDESSHHDWQKSINQMAHKANKDHACEAKFDIL
jgi:hypothetical protein